VETGNGRKRINGGFYIGDGPQLLIMAVSENESQMIGNDRREGKTPILLKLRATFLVRLFAYETGGER
jgi:hypothetical protein